MTDWLRNCIAWFSAGDIVFDDAGNVREWRDRMGGPSLVQADPARRPMARFDGTGGVLGYEDEPDKPEEP